MNVGEGKEKKRGKQTIETLNDREQTEGCWKGDV